jgi:diguanylate cyclase (GGDEF)-like protein
VHSSKRSDALAGAAGRALVTVRREARAAREQLRALAAVVRATGRESDARRIVELAMTQIGLLTRVREWLLLLSVNGEETLVVEQVCGRGLAALRGSTVLAGEGLIGRAAQRRQVVISSPGSGPRARGTDLAGRLGASSLVAVPLLSRGRLIGVMVLVGRGTRRRLGAGDARLATLLLEPVAVALDSAILLRRSEELSVTDDLTKLYNSRFLNAALRREVERSRRYRVPVSLIFLDLDGFKNVNDQHGHLCGSRTLVEVGAVIRGTVREIDIVARFGGDEFCVILPQTGIEGAKVIAERIRERIAARVFMRSHGLEVRITASFGIAAYPMHGSTQDDLIAKADQAMYGAKAAGKNSVRSAAASPAAAQAS